MPFDFKNTSSRPQNRPHPSGNTQGSNDSYSSSLSSLPRPKGSPPVTGGFQNRPEVKKDDSAPVRSKDISPKPTGNGQRGFGSRPANRKTTVRSGPGVSIPWEKVLIVLGVVLALVLVWVFRDFIADFLRTVLSWVLTILIIVLIIKFLFRRKRR